MSSIQFPKMNMIHLVNKQYWNGVTLTWQKLSKIYTTKFQQTRFRYFKRGTTSRCWSKACKVGFCQTLWMIPLSSMYSNLGCPCLVQLWPSSKNFIRSPTLTACTFTVFSHTESHNTSLERFLTSSIDTVS